MQPEQQQRIMGYFIEEARENLAVIEHGLLNLSRVVTEPEHLNEIFRAAHSVKGGAAMLGIYSIQRLAHQLEDGFKVLQDEAIPVDATLESLFLRIFDILNHLLEGLQAPSGLTDERANRALSTAQPLFADLNAHLEVLKQASRSTAAPPLASLEELSSLAAQETVIQEPELEDDPDLADLDSLAALLESSTWEEQPAATSEPAIANLDDLDSLLHNWGEPAESQPPEAAEVLDLLDQLWAETAAPEAGDFLTLDAHAETEPETALAASTDSPAPVDQDPLDTLWQEWGPGSEESAASAEDSLDLEDLQEFEDLEDLAAAIDVAAVSDADSGEHEWEAPPPNLPSIVGSEVEPTPPTEINRLPVAAAESTQASRPGAQTLRVSVTNLDNLSNLVGELVISRNSLTQNQARLHQFLGNLLSQVQELSELGQQMQETYERSLLERSLLTPAAPSTPPSEALPANPPDLGGNQPGFDALEMDRFSHFHSLSQEIIERLVRLREAASDIEFVADETDQVVSVFRQTTAQLQEGLTQVRMVPFAQVADRLPRAVWDLAQRSGKQAHLEIEGRETLVDKGILERLYDPLTHLVSNALTHGIETPALRTAAGKPATGLIQLRAQHQGNQTIISLTDDGAGIDAERVKAKAVEQGLLTAAAAEQLSQIELYDLLFYPGLSTIDQAHELAGRGVGMDAVRTNLRDIKGAISVDSVAGRGTTFTIRLPLTLSISKALCCMSSQEMIAFPIDSVEDMLELSADQLQTQVEGQQILWRGSPLPCRSLSELLVYNRPRPHSRTYGSALATDPVAVVVLRGRVGEFLAVRVDKVLTEQETVIKQLQGPAPKPPGIAGVTVLGDGRVVLIADALELIDLASGRLQLPTKTLPAPATLAVPIKIEPLVLIVDDSITVRELLSLSFAKFGYRVEQARDGREAWEKLESGLACDLVFCDIEMPRMDGFELLTRIQQHPSLAHLPIAMLTSRGSERHRQMAAQLGARAYFTKPYLEESLLDASQRLLQGETLLER